MRSDYSSPVVTQRYQNRLTANSQPDDEKVVDYSHLDIVAEVERITGVTLKHESKNQYSARCPFPNCTSQHNAFLVWDRAILEETSSGKRQRHFYCRRC